MINKKLSGKQIFVVLFIIIAAIVIYVIYQNTSSSGGSTSITQPHDEPQKVTKKVDIPKNVNSISDYLKTFLPKKSQSDILLTKSPQQTDRYYITAQVQLPDNFGLRIISRQAARDFIFAAYNAIYKSKLPIIYASIALVKPDRSLALTVGLGKEVADTQEKTTWTDSSVGPTVFIKWLKRKYYDSNNFHDECFVTGQYVN